MRSLKRESNSSPLASTSRSCFFHRSQNKSWNLDGLGEEGAVLSQHLLLANSLQLLIEVLDLHVEVHELELWSAGAKVGILLLKELELFSFTR